jgi:hypothetical protein
MKKFLLILFLVFIFSLNSRTVHAYVNTINCGFFPISRSLESEIVAKAQHILRNYFIIPQGFSITVTNSGTKYKVFISKASRRGQIGGGIGYLIIYLGRNAISPICKGDISY